MGVFGFDISEYQPLIDWNVIPDEYNFTICRAGYGESAGQKDKLFDTHITAALNKGWDVGVYWFLYATDEAAARRNAESFYNVIKPYIGKINYPLVCDVEGDTVRYMTGQGVAPSRDLISSLVNAFCKYLEDKGFYVSVYSDNGFIDQYFNNDILSKYDLWLADWKTNSGRLEGKPNRKCGIWQYTSRGAVKGITGNVDLNYAYTDYPTLIAQNGLNHLTNADTGHTKKWTVLGGTVTETGTQIIITLDKAVK